MLYAFNWELAYKILQSAYYSVFVSLSSHVTNTETVVHKKL